MKLSDLLIFLIFAAVILYRIYKKKDKVKKDTKEKEINSNTEEKKELSIVGADTAPVELPSIHRVYVQPVDFEKTEDSKKISVSVETAIEDYLADIDRMGALRPANIRFFTNYNRIFIVYVW